MHAKKNEPTHVSSGNIFEDLGFPSEEASILLLKASMHSEILKAIEKQKLTPRQLEKVLGVPQPRVSELMRGKISGMTLDLLGKYLYRLGREVKVTSRERECLFRL
ncbi:helix-turn-helix domain-containing protein [Lacipirellula limnantheis]|uniref:HigA2-like helix-turn-helix domain-containing protein n=1 Tax=Lacipirellula limnantheis TaxID=2528024 RepID=A0A517TY72_9BACT|nr:helix-turn-helix transcriptional regulator [Lacipirellula limnantheis]QDT73319.1 hypothetical protein I41_25080 [Lacipirellula limnantheis]